MRTYLIWHVPSGRADGEVEVMGLRCRSMHEFKQVTWKLELNVLGWKDVTKVEQKLRFKDAQRSRLRLVTSFRADQELDESVLELEAA